MAGVIRRVIFIGKGSDGYNRIADWCRVTTSIGAMVEPWSYNRNKALPAGDYDWTEAGNRIDEIQTYDPGCQLFDDGTTGGPVLPISGY